MTDMITLAQYGDIMLAEVILGRLRAEGIDAVLDDDLAALSMATPFTIEGVRIRVPEDQVEAAADILEDFELYEEEDEVE